MGVLGGGLSTCQIRIKYASKYNQIWVYLLHEVEVRVFTMIFDACFLLTVFEPEVDVRVFERIFDIYLLYLSTQSKYAYLMCI